MAARGRLVPLLAPDSPAARDLQVQGWAIVRACSEERAAALLGKVWDDLEGLGTGIRRDDMTTWHGERWPQTTHGLIQNQGSGLWRGVCEARLETVPVWEALFRGAPCIGSFDAFSFGKPTYQAYAAKHGREPEVPEVANWLHTDQARGKPDLLHHIQGALALTPLGPAELRTQLVAPRDGETAQAFRDRFLAAFPACKKRKRDGDAERAEWIAHTVEEKSWLVANGTVVAPTLAPGEMLLWASGMPHASVAGPLPPGQAAYRPRVSVFVSALPRALLSEAEMVFRRELLEKGRTSGHRVAEPGSRAGQFRQCLFAKEGRTFGKALPEFDLSRALHGFAAADPATDPVLAGTARFCGGYHP